MAAQPAGADVDGGPRAGEQRQKAAQLVEQPRPLQVAGRRDQPNGRHLRPVSAREKIGLGEYSTLAVMAMLLWAVLGRGCHRIVANRAACRKIIRSGAAAEADMQLFDSYRARFSGCRAPLSAGGR